jgi:toxin HigB-1
MNPIFKNDNLSKLEIDATFDGGFEPGIVKAFRKRMQQIWAADDERDFYGLRSLNFEKLKGNRKHQYSMRLNDKWRLIIEFEGSGRGKKVVVIGIEDYHH